MNKTDNPPSDHVVDHDCACKSALQSAENHCKKQGVRLTAIRKQILQLMCQSHHAVKAYDLLEDIKSDFKNAKPATVYRALDFLLKEGFIHKVESLNAFIPKVTKTKFSFLFSIGALLYCEQIERSLMF